MLFSRQRWRSVVGQVVDDGEAWPAVRAVDEGIAVAAGVGGELNAADGVYIHAEGESKLVDEFIMELSDNPPR